MSVNDLTSQLEQQSGDVGVGKEDGEAIACQILLLTLLMDVSVHRLYIIYMSVCTGDICLYRRHNYMSVCTGDICLYRRHNYMSVCTGDMYVCTGDICLFVQETCMSVQEIYVCLYRRHRCLYRRHYYVCLFVQEMPTACAVCVCTEQLLSSSVELLRVTQTKMVTSASAQGQSETPPTTPKWLSPLLLLLDVWEKALAVAEWSKPAKKDCTVVWQWFDNTRWCSYPSDVSQLIEKAYQDKENSIT